MKALLSLSLLATLAPLASAQSAPIDTIVRNGDILTGAALLTPQPQRVQALAITKGRIVFAGTNADADKLPGITKSTKIIDLHGAFAMPGFNDSHTHIAHAGQQRLTVDLVGSTSLTDMQSHIRTYVATAKPGTWLTGGGWDHTLWASKQLPTRQDLDVVTAGHPAILSRVDGHIAIANSAALLSAGIATDTPDPAGARIDRDASGTPTGILRESAAVALVTAKIPPPTLEDRRKALELSIEDALSNGVTSVQDNSGWEDFLALEELEHTGKLHLRVSEWLDFSTPIAVLKTRRASHPAEDLLLHLGQLKGFMDGSLGSRTAALEEPYTDDPTNSGLPRYQQEKLNQMAAERTQAGFQLGFHAIGDRANSIALNAFQAAEQASLSANESPATLRLRIEHAQVLLPADFDRFAREGVIASMQPSHLLTDMAWATDRLGPERSKYAYAWKTFLNHHITLIFGTDYPVESINPFRGLYAATTRQNESGTQTFQPQEKLSIAEALYAYTQAPAFAEFREKQKGVLAPGYLADFIVLDSDPTKAAPQQLLHTRVLNTYLNGALVYKGSAIATTSIALNKSHNAKDDEDE